MQLNHTRLCSYAYAGLLMYSVWGLGYASLGSASSAIPQPGMEEVGVPHILPANPTNLFTHAEGVVSQDIPSSNASASASEVITEGPPPFLGAAPTSAIQSAQPITRLSEDMSVATSSNPMPAQKSNLAQNTNLGSPSSPLTQGGPTINPIATNTAANLNKIHQNNASNAEGNLELTLPEPLSSARATAPDSSSRSLRSQSSSTVAAAPAVKSSTTKSAHKSVQHKKKPAIQEDESFLDSDGQHIALMGEPKPDTKDLLDEAYTALAAGQQEVAVNLYEQVLAVDSHNLSAQLALASLYQQENNNDQAKVLYKAVLTRHPHNEMALNNFLLLLAKEDPEEAIQEFSKLEHLRPHDSTIPAQIAMIYAQQKDYANSTKFMRKAIAMHPDNMAYVYNLALMLDLSGKSQQADNLYLQLLQAKRQGKELPVAIAKINKRLTLLR